MLELVDVVFQFHFLRVEVVLRQYHVHFPTQLLLEYCSFYILLFSIVSCLGNLVGSWWCLHCSVRVELRQASHLLFDPLLQFEFDFCQYLLILLLTQTDDLVDILLSDFAVELEHLAHAHLRHPIDIGGIDSWHALQKHCSLLDDEIIPYELHLLDLRHSLLD